MLLQSRRRSGVDGGNGVSQRRNGVNEDERRRRAATNTPGLALWAIEATCRRAEPGRAMTRNPQIKAARASGAVLICGFFVIPRGLPRQVAFTSADKLGLLRSSPYLRSFVVNRLRSLRPLRPLRGCHILRTGDLH